MEGFGLVIVIIASVLLVIGLTAKFNMQPFLSLIIASFVLGILAGLPLTELVDAVNNGFGNLMSGIGLVIVFGTIIGVMLEKTGAAYKMAEVILRVIGEKRPQLAMSLIGSVVSIPVFCDSGYIILSSLKKAIAKRAQVAVASMAIALSTGLFATHTLVPPTPGPIAAAGNIGAEQYLGTIILIGVVIAIPTIMAGYFWAIKVGTKMKVEGEDEMHIDYDEVVKEFGEMPSSMKAFSPIVLPILLIALGSVVTFAGWEGSIPNLLLFLGDPSVALLAGVISSFALLPKLDKETMNDWVTEGLKTAAPILLITGAGGAFGNVISSTNITGFIESFGENPFLTGAFFLLVPFLIAAALKTAQGSSTTALVITSTLIAPLLVDVGIQDPLPMALVVMAVGAGAMVVSHINDSYFWVVKEFSGMSVTQAYKGQTGATLIQGLVAMSLSILLWIFFV